VSRADQTFPPSEHCEQAVDVAGDEQGRKRAQKPKNAFVQQLLPAHIAYLAALPYTITLPDLNALIVHAGIVPGAPLHSNTASNMTEMRSVSIDSAGSITTSDTAKVGVPWASAYTGTEHIYFGHDAGENSSFTTIS
jgi:hypothetical protein